MMKEDNKELKELKEQLIILKEENEFLRKNAIRKHIIDEINIHYVLEDHKRIIELLNQEGIIVH